MKSLNPLAFMCNPEQKEAMRKMADALEALSDVWTDELGKALNDKGLLPQICLLEGQGEYNYLADSEKLY